MTKEQLHKIVFDEVKHVLGGAPGLSDFTRTSLATQAAVRLTHRVKDSLQLEAELAIQHGRHPADRFGTDT